MPGIVASMVSRKEKQGGRPSQRCSNKTSEESIQMKNLFARFAKDESGATAIEYGLIASLIAVAIIAGATALGGKLNTAFTDISKQVKGK
jgi:pilus assembly protein Flp/PilA